MNESKNKEDPFDFLLTYDVESNKIFHKLTLSIWNPHTTVKDFTQLLENQYSSYVELNKNYLNDYYETEETKKMFSKELLKKFIDSVYDHEKKLEHHFSHIYELLHSQYKTVLPLLFYQLDFKKEAILLLEKEKPNYSSEQYDYFFKHYCKEYRKTIFRNTSFDFVQLDKILEKEKSIFLNIQHVYQNIEKKDTLQKNSSFKI